jgi:deazaflavin-dependent oxidoreductase (nitroreductase family)
MRPHKEEWQVPDEDDARWLTWLIGVPIAVVLAAATTIVLGVRFKIPFVVNTVRGLVRDHLNPRQLQSAGSPGSYAAVVRHVGRKSGKNYETPVVMVPYEGGLVVSLTYGRDTDWVRNLTAVGSATLVYEGETITVDQLRVVPIDTISHVFSSAERRAQRLFGVTDCLVMHPMN